MANSVTLSSAAMTNLLSLQNTQSLIDQTQKRLSTGKKVNSALDNATSFFKNRNLTNRAEDFEGIKANIENGIRVVETAVNSIEDIESYLKQMKAVATTAKGTSAADSATRVRLASQFNELRSQIDHVANDASYDGTNLIKSGADTLTVKFTDDLAATERTLVVQGVDMTVYTDVQPNGGLVIATAGAAQALGNWAGTEAYSGGSGYQEVIEDALVQVETALQTVRAVSQEFGTNSSILEIRKGFTDQMINVLKGGAADLVNADMNEESANMLALQTRQQLGVIALSIAQQSDQSVLRLF